jgi:hypothetical protein
VYDGVQPNSSRLGASFSLSLDGMIRLSAWFSSKQSKFTYDESCPSQNGLRPDILRFALTVRRFKPFVLIAGYLALQRGGGRVRGCEVHVKMG